MARTSNHASRAGSARQCAQLGVRATIAMGTPLHWRLERSRHRHEKLTTSYLLGRAILAAAHTATSPESVPGEVPRK